MKKWFENAPIAKKLSAGFATICVIAVIIGLVGAVGALIIKNADADLYKSYTKGLQDAGNAAVDFQQLRYDMYKLDKSADGTQSEIETAVSAVETSKASLEEHIIACEASLSGGVFSSEYQTIREQLASYFLLIEDNLAAIEKDDFSVMRKNVSSMSVQGAAIRDGFTALFDGLSEKASEKSAANNITAYIVMIVIAAVITVGILISVWLSKTITAVIAPAIQAFVNFAGILAVGDIDADKVVTKEDRLLPLRKDEIGKLAASFDKVIAGTIQLSQETAIIAEGDLTTSVSVRSEHDILGKSIEKLKQDFSDLASSIILAADQVESGAKQLANSSMTLSQGATEQASSVQELSASIADISQRVTSNAHDAEKAQMLSAQSGEIMQDGVANMELTRNAMEEISTTSKNISKVIKAIDDIAFQTNILALNAAVEAARAGAAGKGFAVVADEVRNLSQKSAEAAKDTTTLIESSIVAVEKGTELVNKTNTCFTELASKTNEVNALVDQIASQAQEQATAISQVSTGIEQVSSVVQMNSATSEEAAAASEELSAQANVLKESVSVFKIDIAE